QFIPALYSASPQPLAVPPNFISGCSAANRLKVATCSWIRSSGSVRGCLSLVGIAYCCPASRRPGPTPPRAAAGAKSAPLPCRPAKFEPKTKTIVPLDIGTIPGARWPRMLSLGRSLRRQGVGEPVGHFVRHRLLVALDVVAH